MRQGGQQRVEIGTAAQGEFTRAAARIKVREEQLIALTRRGLAHGAFPTRNAALQAGELGAHHSRYATLFGNGTQCASLIYLRPSPLLTKLTQQPTCNNSLVRGQIGTISRDLACSAP